MKRKIKLALMVVTGAIAFILIRTYPAYDMSVIIMQITIQLMITRF